MTAITVQIAHNAVVAKLLNAPRQVMLEVQQLLSYAVAGTEHMAGFKSSGWDGRANFFDFLQGTFPRGFVTYVTEHLRTLGVNVSLVKKPLPAPLGPGKPVVDAFPDHPRYDYQPEVVRLLLRHGQMIAQIATGGGKSKVAQLCTARINRPTLFLTTREVLMTQMAKKFRAMGKQVAILGAGKLQVSTEVTCGMVQTIAAWLKEPNFPESKDPEGFRKQMAKRAKMIEVLARFEFVILEEAHEAASESFYEVMSHCKNAYYRLALTATPFMKDAEVDNMRLMACSGSVGIHISEKMLIERGILAKPFFKYIKIPTCPPKLFRASPYPRAVELGIVGHEYRNKAIAAEVIRGRSYGLTALILVARKQHGHDLVAMLTRFGVRAAFIDGDSSGDEREAALGRLARGELDALIGTTIMDVGVDVPALGMVILAGGGKAEVALRQRIGRGLREKKLGPNVTFIIDVEDAHNTHLVNHYRQRRAIVEGTPGFAENIVADFDYRSLGFEKLAA
ncbi:DEAD/DEAH box helicase [Achromobacter sp. AGC39]